MSEQSSSAELSLGLVVQIIFVLAMMINVPSAFTFGGRFRFLALAVVSILLLAGFLVVDYRRTRRRKPLHQHVAFSMTWFDGVVLADRLARVVSGRPPKPGPYLVVVGVILNMLWPGSRLAYGGVLAQALLGSD